ncbi:hypothetical protein VTJ83DRAFT_3945 [Remersonia thermophila]|uniref:Uncharacterized protein n=1 Tax=Remersonia thermophila TaxID=72144 RepID=A0ABR4DHR4_9PEZI
MLNFRRALVAAALFITVLFFITWSTSPPSETLAAEYAKAQAEPDTTQPDLNAAVGGSDGTGVRGRPGPHGQHHQHPMQGKFLTLPLYDRLARQYPYDVEAKFPAYIWQTWKWTPAHGEFNFREQEASWTELHPGFVHEVVTDTVASQFVRMLYGPATPEIVEAYDALPLPVLKADFFRYLILLARGGIYADIDTSAIRSALEWIPSSVPRDEVGLVIGIEADPDRPDWQDWYSRRIQFCQWTIQAKPGHPVLRDVVTRITEHALRLKRAGSLAAINDGAVIEFTGPAPWTDAIFDYFNDPRFFDLSRSVGPIDWRNFTGMETPRRVGDVIVLPITSFSPGVRQMGAKDTDDPMAFVQHNFEGSWKPQNERHIGKEDAS